MKRAEAPSMDSTPHPLATIVAAQRDLIVAFRDDRQRLLRLLEKIADECMADEPDVVWIGASARHIVDTLERPETGHT